MMPVSILHILETHSSCIYGVAIVMTIIALAISTRFSLRHLLNIHTVDNNVCALGTKCVLGDASSGDVAGSDAAGSDAAGSDGDDEADPDGEEEATTGEVFDSQQTSSNCQEHLQHCEYIQGEMEQVQPMVDAIEKSVTQQQPMEEDEGKQRQLKEMFRLMQQQGHCGVENRDNKQ